MVRPNITLLPSLCFLIYTVSWRELSHAVRQVYSIERLCQTVALSLLNFTFSSKSHSYKLTPAPSHSESQHVWSGPEAQGYTLAVPDPAVKKAGIKD